MELMNNWPRSKTVLIHVLNLLYAKKCDIITALVKARYVANRLTEFIIISVVFVCFHAVIPILN